MTTPFAGEPIRSPRDSGATTTDQSASSRIYDALRSRILSLEIPPGQRLSRNEMARQFSVSASPLREALQRLEIDGLVATYRQSRTVVTHIDPDVLIQENFLRTGIECEVVYRLAAREDKEAVEKAAALLKMQRVLGETVEQIDLFRRLDEDFHRELFAAVGQVALHQRVMQRSNQMARLRTIDLPRKGKSSSVIAGHQAIIDAIQASDPHAAADAMRDHLSGTISRLPEIMTQHPDYFRHGD